MGKTRTFAALIMLACGLASMTACTPQNQEPSASEATASTSYAENSLAGQHEARGTDISNLADVSVETCTATGCHGGSWDAVVEETDAIWEGLGQIGEANPHAAHATNGYACSDCHSLFDGASVNQCNGCHAFETPDGWEDKDPTSTVYGLTQEEPLY